MGSYLLAISLLVLAGYGIQISRWKNWSGNLLIADRSYHLSVAAIFWSAAFLVLVLFGGLRYYVGTDFESYYNIFLDICEDWYEKRYRGTESGFIWLNRILSLYTENPQWLIFVTNGFVSFFCIWAVVKESKFVPFSLYILFTTLYYQSFNLIRQGMACSLVLVAFTCAKRRKWLRCYGLILSAVLFHKTALIALPLMFLMQFRYSRKVYGAFFVLAALGGLLRGPLTGLLLRFYPSAADLTNSYLYEDFSRVQVFLCLIYVVLCFLYYERMLQKDKGNIIYINFAVLLLGVYAFFYWIPMWGRLQLYFIGFFALIVPEVIACEESKYLRILYYTAVWGFLLVTFIASNWYSCGLWPYQTIFSK